MLPSLRPETRDLLAQLETEARVPVRLEASEPHYPGRSRISSYMKDPSRITISYSPRAKSPDHAVAHEAARFLRFWRAPPKQRQVLECTSRARRGSRAARARGLHLSG